MTMELNKNLRSTIKPSNDLYRRDVRSSVVTVPTGRFTRNCVLSGKCAGDMDYPIYIRTPGIVSNYSPVYPDGLGYFESSEGIADNVFPTHKDLTNNSWYLEATTPGANITYCHPLRPTTIRSYRFVTINGYTPRSWKIQGSNDNLNWNTLHEVTVSWTWGTGKIKVQYDIPLEKRAEYKYHRLQVDEFDVTSIRIYSLQFYDSLCPTNSCLYLDASSENPLQLAFMDGYNVDGSPKDIVKIINSSELIDLYDFSDNINSELAGTDVINVMFFCVYNQNTDTISFEPKLPNYQSPVNILRDYGCISTTSANIIDNNLNTSFCYDFSKTLQVKFLNPILTDRLWYYASTCYDSDAKIDFRCSEDYGVTWSNWVKLLSYRQSLEVRTYKLDRIYNINSVEFLVRGGLYGGRNSCLYEFSFFDASSLTELKISSGKVYEHDYVEDAWHQVYKIPLGYFSLIRDPEDTAWEIANFIPTHIPQMAISPHFTKVNV